MNSLSALPPSDRQRLVKLLGLLGSDYAGERAAAGLLATRLLKNSGLMWSDVVDPPAPDMPTFYHRDGPSDYGRYLALCVENYWRLTDWERAFICSLQRQRGSRIPSAKQQATLAAIAAKVRWT